MIKSDLSFKEQLTLQRQNEKFKKEFEEIENVKKEYNQIIDNLQKSHNEHILEIERKYNYLEIDIQRLNVSDSIIKRLYAERTSLKSKIVELEYIIQNLFTNDSTREL